MDLITKYKYAIGLGLGIIAYMSQGESDDTNPNSPDINHDELTEPKLKLMVARAGDQLEGYIVVYARTHPDDQSGLDSDPTLLIMIQQYEALKALYGRKFG